MFLDQRDFPLKTRRNISKEGRKEVSLPILIELYCDPTISFGPGPDVSTVVPSFVPPHRPVTASSLKGGCSLGIRD